DEYQFNPYRTRAFVGQRIVWGNNGQMTHTIIAKDGSWTTGPIKPGGNAAKVFDKPGRYIYVCKEHPWSYGQLIVEDPAAVVKKGVYAEPQATRGSIVYNRSCAQCHGQQLAGVGSAPALIGERFASGWSGSNVGELFDRIRTTMPQGAGGSLSDQNYLDIAA